MKTFYRNLEPKKRKKFKEEILLVTVKRKEQIVLIDELLVSPIKELNELARSVLKSEYPIEIYLERSKQLSRHLKKCLKEIPK